MGADAEMHSQTLGGKGAHIEDLHQALTLEIEEPVEEGRKNCRSQKH